MRPFNPPYPAVLYECSELFYHFTIPTGPYKVWKLVDSNGSYKRESDGEFMASYDIGKYLVWPRQFLRSSPESL